MDELAILAEVKRSIEITETDLDPQLTDFIKRTIKQLKVRLGFVDEVPTELDYIVTDVTIKRFNRKGDEGMNSYSQEGQSINYAALLAEFEDDINAWLKKKRDEDNPNANRSAAMFV